MSNIAFRTGHKVILRPFEIEDAPLIAPWMNDPEITQFLMRSMPVSLGEEEEWIRKQRKQKDNSVTLAIVAKQDRVLIGSIGLHNIDWVHGRATTGTVIGDAEYHGKGYGTDAKMLLLEAAFNQLNLRKVCSTVHAFNGRSIRYGEKCGYVEEGRLKDHNFINGKYVDEVRMAVFRDNWLPLWKKYRKGL